MINKKWQTEFGLRLKIERSKRELTRKALAIKANISQDYIAQLERGNKNPSLRTLMRILNVLDISSDSLLFGLNTYNDNETENIANKIYAFLSNRTTAEAKNLYEIIKFLSVYLKV